LSLFAIDTHCTRVRFIHCSGVCSVVTGLVVCSGDSNSCFPNQLAAQEVQRYNQLLSQGIPSKNPSSDNIYHHTWSVSCSVATLLWTKTP